jgi:hypothetical protein
MDIAKSPASFCEANEQQHTRMRSREERSMQEESWFFEWHQPVEFHQRHNAVGRGIQDADHRRQSYKWYREAWVLKLFAIATDASDLRLIKDDPPDGEVRLAGKIIPTEIVEVFEEGRQPDKEFRQGPRKHLSTLSQWDNELTFIKTSLDNRINKKERNNYPNDTVLEHSPVDLNRIDFGDSL